MSYEYALHKGSKLRHSTMLGKESVYTIEKVLGQGGFGITYLAFMTLRIGNTPHKIPFAIKEFFVKRQCWRDSGSPHVKFSPAAKSEIMECRKDFIAEANRLNKICAENTNIVNVNEVFEANDTAYYVMEFLSGKSLRDKVLAMKAPLSERLALSYIIPIARSVDYIHTEHRLLHCDISPDNIMLRDNEDGTSVPVLIDFGESLHFNSRGELTTTHTAVGAKEGYAPPEQYSGVKSFKPQIDVYALGATLFYLLVGKKPISAFDINPEYIKRSLPLNISTKTREAILHAMEKDKENRTPTVKSFVEALEVVDETPRQIPVSLSAGYILKGDGGNIYEILAEQERTPFYIRYKAERGVGKISELTAGATRRARCDVYEFFDQKNHLRQENSFLMPIDDISSAQSLYVSFCQKKIGNGISVYSWKGDGVRWNAFKANNTLYMVDSHEKPPLPWKKIRLIVFGIIPVLLFYVLISYISSPSLFERNAATMLKEAVEQQDTTTLKSLVTDSAYQEAIVPLANLYLAMGREDLALKYAEMGDTATNKEAREIVKNIIEKRCEDLDVQIRRICENLPDDANARVSQLVQARRLSDSVQHLVESRNIADEELLQMIKSNSDRLTPLLEKESYEWERAGDSNPIVSVRISCYEASLRLYDRVNVRMKLKNLKNDL